VVVSVHQCKNVSHSALNMTNHACGEIRAVVK